MLIAVIADTHGRLPEGFRSQLSGVGEIWHLGDFCDAATLTAVQSLGPPIYAVLGNHDHTLDLPKSLRLERHGRSFFLIHIPPLRPAGADFLLHGHTHVPRDEMVGSTRILNPGSIGKANKGAPPSWGLLMLEEDGNMQWYQPIDRTEGYRTMVSSYLTLLVEQTVEVIHF